VTWVLGQQGASCDSTCTSTCDEASFSLVIGTATFQANVLDTMGFSGCTSLKNGTRDVNPALKGAPSRTPTYSSYNYVRGWYHEYAVDTCFARTTTEGDRCGRSHHEMRRFCPCIHQITTPTPSGYIRLYGDCAGNNLTSLSGVNTTLCGLECDQLPNCAGFS
jgi:hypothetical protein